jgi:hypothetical protein
MEMLMFDKESFDEADLTDCSKQDLPCVRLSADSLNNKSPVQRAAFIAKAFCQDRNASAFAKSALLHRLLGYVSRLASPNSALGTYGRLAHSMVTMFEADSLVRSSLQIIKQAERCESIYDVNYFENTVMRVLREKFFTNASLQFWQWTDDYVSEFGETYSVDDIVFAFGHLDAEVAKRHDFEIVHSENIDNDGSTYNLYVVKTSSQICAFTCRGSKENRWAVSRCAIYMKTEQYSGEVVGQLMELFSVVARENFIKIVDPERNIVELMDTKTRIMPRKPSFEHLPNVDTETIETSIRSAITNKRKRVIALVGDPGLGKTLAVHHIVNMFPKVPTFMVTASALGESPSAKAVRSIFNAVASFESILVLDDFEGFGLSEKNAVVNEFLNQLDGSAGFHGIAILVVNDPSLVHYTIMDRPGRVDEVYEISYLTNPDDMRTVIRAQYPALTVDASYDKALRYMAKEQFSTARILHATQFMIEHYEISPDSLLSSAKRLKEFQRTARKHSNRGRLVDSHEDPTVEPKTTPSRSKASTASVKRLRGASSHEPVLTPNMLTKRVTNFGSN